MHTFNDNIVNMKDLDDMTNENNDNANKTDDTAKQPETALEQPVSTNANSLSDDTGKTAEEAKESVSEHNVNDAASSDDETANATTDADNHDSKNADNANVNADNDDGISETKRLVELLQETVTESGGGKIMISEKAARKMKKYMKENGEDSSWVDDMIQHENSDENTDSNSNHPVKDFLKAHRVFLTIYAIIIVIALIAIPSWFLYFRNKVEAPQSNVKYTISRYEHKWVQTGLSEKMKEFSVNEKQWIQTDVNGKNQYCFGFQPGGDNAPKPEHTMRAILSFGDSKSRNFMIQNYSPISMGIKSGYMNMEFCFLQTQNEYSVLAVEALSEVDYNDDSKTFEAIYNLMMENTSDLTDTDKRINAIIGVLAKMNATKEPGKTEISADSIRQGSFYQFGYSMSESQRADYVPAILVDNEAINSDVPIYDPDSMWNYIRMMPKMDSFMKKES